MDAATPYWWIEHVSVVTSIPLALLGFGITVWQIIKTKSAAFAATRAATRTLAQMQGMSMISLLPQLSRIDDEIDRAVDSQSAEILRFWISQWKWQAGEMRGYLDAEDRAEEKIMRAIQSSISAASDVRRELHNVTPDQLVGATEDLRKLIGRVTGELSMLAARRGVLIGGGSEA